MKTIFEPDTGVGLGSHTTTSQHPHCALLTVVETPVTPPTVGAQLLNPLYGFYAGPSIEASVVLRQFITIKPNLCMKTYIYKYRK